MLAYDSFQMNYHNLNPASMQPLASPISLPPISSIDFRVPAAHQSPPDVIQPLPLPPPPPRHLPPLSYYNGGRQIPQEPQYVQQQSFYRNMQAPSQYAFGPGTRVPLPSTTDPSLMVAPARHKTKEVKRRTKTGCLTCRKRRIKCDEGRPECRNCMKSKRQCLGYDPVFQSQGPHSLHPAPASTISNNSTTATTSSSTSQPRGYTLTPSSPSHSNHTASLPNTSPREHTDYSFPKPPDLLPHINQPYRMDDSSQRGLPSYTSASRSRHSIEEICTISGTKIPTIPAIPQDSVPNLDSIRKVYDIAFAHGLDKFLESSQQWFSKEGFELLAGNRALLGLVLAYLTLVSSNHDAPIDANDTLASQEARVAWGLLSLCVRPDHHGDAEADKLARRFRVLESLLTGEPLTSTPASMSEFVHQEPEPEPEPKQDIRQSTFEMQLARRSEDFWRTLEAIASAQGRGNGGVAEIKERLLPQARALLDGRESRDVIYSAVMLGWDKNGDPSSERELAKRFLQAECSGRATDLVCKTVSGMALRAFDS